MSTRATSKKARQRLDEESVAIQRANSIPRAAMPGPIGCPELGDRHPPPFSERGLLVFILDFPNLATDCEAELLKLLQVYIEA